METNIGEVNYSIPALKTNEYQLQMTRILIALIAGIVSGILRVEGIIHGMGMFALWNVIGSVTVILYMGGLSGALKYFPNGVGEIFLSQIFSGIMTFILVWTVVYDIVHIF